jgi:hypothetical protein
MLDMASLFFRGSARREPSNLMKTTSPPLKILLSLIVAIAATCLAQPVCATAVTPTLTLTEVSNTQLNWAWDAAGGGTSGTITALTPDVWGPTSISGNGFGSGGFVFVNWQEPESTGFQNQVSFLIPAVGLGGGYRVGAR